MLAPALALAAAASSIASASPIDTFSKRAMAVYDANVQIHPSCNATQREALQAAMADVNNITETAKLYVAANGAEDPLFQKWFGNGDYVAVMGALDAILFSNKANVTLRCDNIDGNCGQEGWAGHWRGANATQETVICDLSYQIREPLSEMCQNNYTVAGSSPSYYWATDLIHRLYHVPSISDEEVSHYADSYTECLELAQHNSSWAPYNTHSLQYFVAEVYANEVALPGVGCTGLPPPEEEGDGHSHGATTGTDVAATATASAAASCHTHSDGETHCV